MMNLAFDPVTPLETTFSMQYSAVIGKKMKYIGNCLSIKISNFKLNTQCSKIRKKCNFKSIKTHFMPFQQWQKKTIFAP